MIHEIDGLHYIDILWRSAIKERIDDRWVKDFGWGDANTEGVFVPSRRATFFHIKINHELHLVHVLGRPGQLIAIPDDLTACSVSSLLGVPNLAINDSLLATIADEDIVLADFDLRKFDNFHSIDFELNGLARAVKAWASLELGRQFVLRIEVSIEARLYLMLGYRINLLFDRR